MSMIVALALAVAGQALAADERAALEQATARGTMIAAYDRAAWLATDDLKSRLPDARSRIGGWIVDGPATAPTVVFFDRSATPRAVYAATLDKGRLTDVTMPVGEAAALTPERQALIAARTSATKEIVASGIRPCSTSFNTVVLPPEAPGGPSFVYF